MVATPAASCWTLVSLSPTLFSRRGVIAFSISALILKAIAPCAKIGSGYARLVGHVPKKYLPIDLFDIHVRLYKCVKIWRNFSQSSISPNFSGAKVSLHTVYLEMVNHLVEPNCN